MRNPLRLRKKKDPIVGAQGHVFDTELTCGHCGKEWADQRVDPSGCRDSAETEAAPALEGDRASEAPQTEGD